MPPRNHERMLLRAKFNTLDREGRSVNPYLSSALSRLALQMQREFPVSGLLTRFAPVYTGVKARGYDPRLSRKGETPLRARGTSGFAYSIYS